MSVLDPGSHGSTYGGNPLGAAVAVEALKVPRDVKLPEHTTGLGDYFVQGLRAIGNKNVKATRARGLLVGLGIKPESGVVRPFYEKLMEKGIPERKLMRF